MKILFAGCSYCGGAELQNIEESRYSRIVSNAYNATEINIGRGGASNQNILYATYDALQRDKTITHVHLNMTYVERFMLPGVSGYINVNPNTTQKNILMQSLIKLIYKNSKLTVQWFNYIRPLFELLLFYCESKGIQCIVSCIAEKDLSFFSKYNCIDVAFDTIRDKYPVGEGGHPLEDAHREFANYIIRKLK